MERRGRPTAVAFAAFVTLPGANCRCMTSECVTLPLQLRPMTLAMMPCPVTEERLLHRAPPPAA